MNKSHDFLSQVIRPVLMRMGMHSLSAEILLMMIAAHESAGFKYRRQHGGGPALSYFQIEPATMWDLVERYLANRPSRRALVFQFAPLAKSQDQILEALEHNDEFSSSLARMKLASIPAPLPEASDLVGISQYAKTYWNTPAGKATPEKYLNDFKRYMPDPVPAEWRLLGMGD